MLKKKVTQILRYNAIFDPAEEGGFTVTVPKLPGLVTEGDTYEKALENVRDAIKGYIQILRENTETVPEPDRQTFTTPIDIHISGSRFAIA
ncbi:HicB family protein [Candidatus Collierbacteria bacterium CG17_big_fil_post_rev_8_21_14_2_50_45_7]|uniref:HicB family protein n=2 Tax=Candidatus Collieribacteriota TaxID=1752725 RepID=A0A2H0WZ59_9BACT|nr:MAG: HicB family protein [Candidatus Collierbacteria bacterium CG09_land_8_20_14_0_10_46_12]PIW08173.1 MAG: HicB family protein [Candidatus Collierbacteria bacterium CG17_big_fil_post_rev_8_21_14_2_50_45_7]